MCVCLHLCEHIYIICTLVGYAEGEREREREGGVGSYVPKPKNHRIENMCGFLQKNDKSYPCHAYVIPIYIYPCHTHVVESSQHFLWNSNLFQRSVSDLPPMGRARSAGQVQKWRIHPVIYYSYGKWPYITSPLKMMILQCYVQLPEGTKCPSNDWGNDDSRIALGGSRRFQVPAICGHLPVRIETTSDPQANLGSESHWGSPSLCLENVETT